MPNQGLPQTGEARRPLIKRSQSRWPRSCWQFTSIARGERNLHRASNDDPQYEITSDKTNHVAVHKGSALRKISP
jgi:hypothetical protein